MGASAVAHGQELLKLGYTVDQVVHDYGDLCQAMTDLAFERDAPFSVDEFRTLNRCLDNAIAGAVTEYSAQRDTTVADQQSIHENEQLGFLMHELRNSLGTASLAVSAMERGQLTLAGATGSVLKRSLAAMAQLIHRSLTEVRTKDARAHKHQIVSLAALVAEAKSAAEMEAATRGCRFTVTDVDPRLGIDVNRELLLAALMNLLNNAFKFTHRHSEVTLIAYEMYDRIRIEVRDHCGGLAPGIALKMFEPFSQHNEDKTGLGLGLSIARKSVEADGGTLSVRDVPGTGCIFTIELHRYLLK